MKSNIFGMEGNMDQLLQKVFWTHMIHVVLDFFMGTSHS